MNVAVLLIAVLSLVLAGLSLGWQVAAWLLSGGRPKAVLLHGLVDGVRRVAAPVTKSGERMDLSKLRRQGINGTEMVGIQVTNHGRAPIVIESVSIHTRGGVMVYTPVGVLVGQRFPCQIDPGNNQSWYVSIETALNLASTSRDALDERVTGVYMTAGLATGKTVKTKRSLKA